MRVPLIAGNWKMYKTVRETVAHISELRSAFRDLRGVDVIVAPPFTALHAAADAVRDSVIAVSAQNMHWEREGAFTGEVSAAMIREAGATHVIVGHSERRGLFGETDQTVNKKLVAAFSAQLIPIMCVGETLEERDRNQTLSVLDHELQHGLDGITAAQLRGAELAYEPVWAIGTGRTATPAQAQEAHAHIRSRLRQWFGVETAERVRILYGGSVKTDNIASLIAEPDVDGALVGGASLDARAFIEIVLAAVAVR